MTTTAGHDAAQDAAQPPAPIRIGCQLNAWQRELDLRAPAWGKLDAALGQLVEAGYAGVEVPHWSVPDLDDPAPLRDACARRGAALVSLHAGGPFFDDAAFREQTLPRALAVARFAAAAGAQALAVSHASLKGRVEGFGRPEGRSGPEWRAQVRNLSELARRLADLGLRTWYHNHSQQFEYDGWEMDSVLAADREYAGLCVDVGHAYQSMPQDNLLAWLDRHWHRVGCLHYKDIRAGGVVEALGDGEVDFAAVTRLARARRFDGWIVAELDTGPRGTPPSRSPLENTRRSYDVIQSALRSA